MVESLNSFLKKHKFSAGIIDYSRIEEIGNEIGDLYKNNHIDKAIYKEYLKDFEYGIEIDSFKPRSVITIAVPRPQHRVYFNLGSNRISTLIPPTYVDYKRIYKKIGMLLGRHLSNTGHKILRAKLPEKLLGARSGLIQYGRNNISYIESSGSFFQLTSFFSSLEPGQDNWHEKKELKDCRDCTACLKNCPTGAISARRFLLRSSKCLTYHNEKTGSFPAWINRRSHNCLVGCMRCQDICPYNKSFIDWIEDVREFTGEETESILDGSPSGKLPVSVVKKLDDLGLEWLTGEITRNLKALFYQKDK